MKLFDLTGKVALVTGGNGGIGLAMSKAMGEAGATIIIAGRNEEKNTQSIKILNCLQFLYLTHFLLLFLACHRCHNPRNEKQASTTRKRKKCRSAGAEHLELVVRGIVHSTTRRNIYIYISGTERHLSAGSRQQAAREGREAASKR